MATFVSWRFDPITNSLLIPHRLCGPKREFFKKPDLQLCDFLQRQRNSRCCDRPTGGRRLAQPTPAISTPKSPTARVSGTRWPVRKSALRNFFVLLRLNPKVKFKNCKFNRLAVSSRRQCANLLVLTLFTRPSIRKTDQVFDPPELIRGSGMPVTGIRPTTMPTFTRT